MRMKVIQSTEKINPFGEINFVIDQLNKADIASLIDSDWILGGLCRRTQW